MKCVLSEQQQLSELQRIRAAAFQPTCCLYADVLPFDLLGHYIAGGHDLRRLVLLAWRRLRSGHHDDSMGRDYFSQRVASTIITYFWCHVYVYVYNRKLYGQAINCGSLCHGSLQLSSSRMSRSGSSGGFR